VAARSKAWVCSRLVAGIVGSNLAGGVYVSCERCVLRGRADHSSSRVLPSVVCLSVMVKALAVGAVAPWVGLGLG
jgi:hypothetical protein